MADALYYPTYVPNKYWLRSALLFFDRVHTIVPKEDQPSAKRRPYVEELLAKDPQVIEFESPTRTILEAAFREADYEVLVRVVEQIKADVENPVELNRARLDTEYRARLAQKGLGQHLARQKLPDELFQRLMYAGLAIETDPLYDPALQVYISERPVLTHPRVADFVMARLAEAVARQNRLASLTDRLNDFAYNAFYNVRPRGKGTADSDLLAMSLKLIVPPDIARLSADSYSDLRAQYEIVREAARRLFVTVAHDKRLESEPELCDYIDAVRDAANEVAQRIERAEKERGTEERRAGKEFTLMSVAELGGAGMGAGLGAAWGGVAGGVVGALLGAGLAVGAKVLARVGVGPERPRVEPGETYRALATLRKDITKAAKVRRLIYPGAIPA